MLKKFAVFSLFCVIVSIAFSQNSSTKENCNDYKLVVSGECLEIYLPDTSAYSQMNDVQKKILVDFVTKESKAQRVVVRQGYTREVWINVPDSGYVFVTEKNINEFTPDAYQKYSDKEYSKCDFFSYGGMSMDFSSSHFVFSVSTRFGCYFFRRLFDLSITFTYSLSAVKSMNSSAMSLGLMGRVYPFYKMESLKKYRLSPYVGLEGALYGSFTDNSRKFSGNFIGHIGISWLVGPGSLDVGFQSGIKEYFTATIGYSFCPSMLSGYRKTRQKKF